jgi:hypothetical protein
MKKRIKQRTLILGGLFLLTPLLIISSCNATEKKEIVPKITKKVVIPNITKKPGTKPNPPVQNKPAAPIKPKAPIIEVAPTKPTTEADAIPKPSEPIQVTELTKSMAEKFG